MKANNQLVVLSGILVLLATATIAVIYNVQTVEAKSTGSGNFGQMRLHHKPTTARTIKPAGTALDAKAMPTAQPLEE